MLLRFVINSETETCQKEERFHLARKLCFPLKGNHHKVFSIKARVPKVPKVPKVQKFRGLTVSDNIHVETVTTTLWSNNKAKSNNFIVNTVKPVLRGTILIKRPPSIERSVVKVPNFFPFNHCNFPLY